MPVNAKLAAIYYQNKSLNNSSHLGQILKDERSRQGYDIRTVAKNIGVTSAYISQLENGKKNNPTIRVINDYADFLGIDLIEFAVRQRVSSIKDTDGLNSLISDLNNALETLNKIKEMDAIEE